MKTKLITFCVTITIFLNACSDYEEFISDQPDIMTRAIVDKNHPSISNPDLINNWENLTRVYLNTKEPTSWTELPWVENGTNSALPQSFRFL